MLAIEHKNVCSVLAGGDPSNSRLEKASAIRHAQGYCGGELLAIETISA